MITVGSCCIGNAVCVPVVTWIGERLADWMKEA
jgi:hypothetical protein